MGLAGLADFLKELHIALKLGGAGAILLHEIGDGNIFHADFHIFLDGALHVRHQLLKGDVGGNGLQARSLNSSLDFSRLLAVQPGKLYAVIADFLDFFHSAGKILLSVITDGVNLHGNG